MERSPKVSGNTPKMNEKVNKRESQDHLKVIIVVNLNTLKILVLLINHFINRSGRMLCDVMLCDVML
jgi:hypothetical protein